MKFSILIPAYKTSYLKDCIQSILNQSFEDYEVIVVDDASPNDVLSVVRLFDDKRIRYYRNEIGFGGYNVVGNWNKCLEYATGDYVICMGDDDILAPDSLVEYVKLIERYPGLGLYHGLTEIIDENGNFVTMQESRPEYESVYSMIWHRWTIRKHQYIGDWVFDMAHLRANGGFYQQPLAWGSDDISAVIAAAETGVANTNVICFKYRENQHTISNSGNGIIKINAIAQEEKWFKEFFKTSICKEPLSTLYISCCNDVLESYFRKEYLVNIRLYMYSHPIKGIVWIRKGKRYGLSTYILLKCWIGSLLDRKKLICKLKS